MINIKKAHSSKDYVCTTADIWLQRKRSFLGMTAHVVDPETLQRESFAIACERFSGTHSFDSIAEKIQEVHDKIGLDYKKITRTIQTMPLILQKFFVRLASKSKIKMMISRAVKMK